MTDTPRPWDRLPTETLKAHTSFLAYVALGARRSVHEAARAHHGRATAAGEIHGRQKTTVRTWEGWSARHHWVSRAIQGTFSGLREHSACTTRRFNAWRMSRSGLRICPTCLMRR